VISTPIIKSPPPNRLSTPLVVRYVINIVKVKVITYFLQIGTKILSFLHFIYLTYVFHILHLSVLKMSRLFLTNVH